MATKIFLGGIILMIMVAGLIIYINNREGAMIEKLGEQVSFICDDGNDFIAEFSPDMSVLNVIVAGNLKYSLSNTGNETIPYRFGDNEHEYTFTGEEVIVTSSDMKEGVVCNQPFDPNNAPYNFGDSGEGAGEDQDIKLAITENLEGTWKSVDDEKFSRSFHSDGLVIDHYEGSEDTAGKWEVFTASSSVTTSFQLQPGAVYLRIMMGDSKEETLHFLLSKLTPEELELIYMERGGVLRFSFVE
ncbi:hypothetical protein A2392_00935 [Candidatus Kaiserbacteria bacterium RIFOXYB1_FULL_46_14]|uniref:Uncharacterized protein n=1 Tax=Candidatus Kaiserbacteria bacterium RIFOXYB1_FULL_46_14 TaxID=1798531 RepID=A0A1F6FJI1_9BACT|nr:MAG: hypothetical protein A2392_00935 [Candidatus Kaiserbacteria bacterium RIFOXYB1_FULL_46_14]